MLKICDFYPSLEKTKIGFHHPPFLIIYHSLDDTYQNPNKIYE